MKTDDFKRVADELKDDLVLFTQKLLQTPSMSGNEAAVAQLTIDEMEKLGFDQAFIDGAGNAVGIVRGQQQDAPVYALNSHLDHVDPGEASLWKHAPYSGDISAGCIYGRGASDTKGAFAVQVYCLGVLRRMGLKPKGDVYVTGVVMEEVGGFGTRYFLENTDRKPDCVVLGEGTENNIKLGHRAGIRAKASFIGKGAHASAPERGINPHYAAARFLLALEKVLPTLKKDPDLGQTTVAPTVYTTGVSSNNVIPGQVDIFLDMRSVAETADEALGIYRHIAKEACPPEIRTVIEPPQRSLTSYTGLKDPFKGSGTESFKLEKDNGFVQKAVSVITQTMGRPPALGYWLFCTDGRYSAEAGIPTYGFSPCEERLAHTADDHIKIDMMMDSLYCYPQILI
jgi:succinyl-diaminopimelate desuccinylase